MFSLLLITSTPAVAAEEWRLVSQTKDCKVYVDETQETYTGKTTCLWTDVGAERVIEALEDPTHAPSFFSNVKESLVLSQSGDTMRVFQVHKFPIGNDRETYKNVTNVALADGLRIEWSRLASCPAPTQGRVTLETDTGYWQVRKGSAGTEVEFFMAYAPGGFLGVFPANKFMTDGMSKTLAELHTEATK